LAAQTRPLTRWGGRAARAPGFRVVPGPLELLLRRFREVLPDYCLLESAPPLGKSTVAYPRHRKTPLLVRFLRFHFGVAPTSPLGQPRESYCIREREVLSVVALEPVGHSLCLELRGAVQEDIRRPADVGDEGERGGCGGPPQQQGVRLRDDQVRRDHARTAAYALAQRLSHGAVRPIAAHGQREPRA